MNLPAILPNEPNELEPSAKLAASVIQVDDENEDEPTHFSPADLERAYGEEEANTATESKNRNIEGLTRFSSWDNAYEKEAQEKGHRSSRIPKGKRIPATDRAY